MEKWIKTDSGFVKNNNYRSPSFLELSKRLKDAKSYKEVGKIFDDALLLSRNELSDSEFNELDNMIAEKRYNIRHKIN